MHTQPHFREANVDTLHALIRSHPLGTFVVLGESGLEVNHMPFHLDATVGGNGVLRAHMPRGNPLWQQVLDGAQEAVVVFQGPESYITPSWYETKREHGQAVPTWNYVVVHAYGRPAFVQDKEWLRAHVTALTTQHEAARQSPWQVTDAPADYIDRMLGNIVGIEIAVSRLLGKWKVSQNRPMADRMGVVEGLQSLATEKASAMEVLVKQHL